MYQVAILKNESPNEHRLWLKACEENKNVRSTVIDITKSHWLEELKRTNYDLVLLKPPGRSSLFKQLYDERVYIINSVLNTPIYPSIDHILIYENKRLLRDWLNAQGIQHPSTEVIFNKKEAEEFKLKNKGKWVVAKTNIGSSGKGVRIIKNSNDLDKYIQNAFSSGIKVKSGPKLFTGNILTKLKKATKKGFLKNRMNEYKVSASQSQKDFVILQEYIPHDFEWRCVVIGDSFFAHKKIIKGDKTSGTLLKDYDEVPLKLLDFIKSFTDQTGINSSSIDLFEYQGKYLINEVQSFFGQSDPYQMLKDGKPGRYRYINNEWKFEEGMYNTNECYDLRLKHALTQL